MQMMLSKVYIWILSALRSEKSQSKGKRFVVYSDEYRAYYKGSRVYTSKKEDAIVYCSQKRALSEILKYKIREAALCMI